MSDALAILFGLGAAAFWGTADFLAKQRAEQEGGAQTLLWLYLAGAPLYILFAAAWGTEPPATSTLGWWFAAGTMNAAAYLLLYRGFQVGYLSVVTTANAAWAAITVVLTSLFAGAWPPARAALGVAMAVTGVSLISYTGGGFESKAAGLREGIGSAICFGVSFALLEHPMANGDAFYQAAVMRLTGLAVVVTVLLTRAALTHRSARWKNFLRLPPLFALLDSFGFLCFVTGLARGAAYIVAPLGSLLTAVAVALGVLFLHERLHPQQWTGFALAIAAAVLLAT